VINLIEYLLGIAFVLIGIGFSIGLHEIGHLVPAKLFGARVPKYMIGFGPTLFSVKRGETEYGIKALPLGGYISISGMMPPAKEGAKKLSWLGNFVASARRNQQEVDGEFDQKRAFYNLSVWKRVVVMTGGPLMNLLLGVVFTAIVVSGIGVWDQGNRLAQVMPCVPHSVDGTCKAGDPPSPALVAGLKTGDRIVALNGKPITTFAPVTALLENPSTKPIRFTVERGASRLNLSVTPVIEPRPYLDLKTGSAAVNSEGKPLLRDRALIGVQLESVRQTRGIGEAFKYSGEMVARTAEMIFNLPAQLVKTVNDTLAGNKRDGSGPVSVVGVANIAGGIAESNQIDLTSKLASGLMMLASLNFGLFVFNMVPLLPLDGGHVLSALYDGLKRGIYRLLGKADPGPLDTAKLVPFTMVMWVVLMALSLVIILADFINPVTLGL
jgi:membrane-associated protease RseP (regulator of RpoE activity)